MKPFGLSKNEFPTQLHRRLEKPRPLTARKLIKVFGEMGGELLNAGCAERRGDSVVPYNPQSGLVFKYDQQEARVTEVRVDTRDDSGGKIVYTIKLLSSGLDDISITEGRYWADGTTGSSYTSYLSSIEPYSHGGIVALEKIRDAYDLAMFSSEGLRLVDSGAHE